MRKAVFIIMLCIMGVSSCTKDGDIPSTMKGIVAFKSYSTSAGLRPVIYSGGQIKFIMQMQLAGASQSINADVEYHILDGNTKIADGKVKVNKNVDGGLGMFWESEEKSHTIDPVALKGKTLTVYLDPSNKFTGSQYTSETYVNQYKKGSITIP